MKPKSLGRIAYIAKWGEVEGESWKRCTLNLKRTWERVAKAVVKEHERRKAEAEVQRG